MKPVIKPIGIDLGTTYSAIACWEDSTINYGPRVYNCPSEGQNYIASKIFFPDIKNREVATFGKWAIRHSITRPEGFFSAFKRDMAENKPIVRTEGSITPVELSALFLENLLKRNVQPVEGDVFIPEGVVVSVPYYFTDPPTRNTRKALGDALEKLYSNHPGYEPDINLNTIPEPIAAGLDYAFTQLQGAVQKTVLIFDLGGGTFDVTIYRLENEPINQRLDFTIMATDGHPHLGGEDFDQSLRRYILDKYKISKEAETNPDYNTCHVNLYNQVTDAKIALSDKNCPSVSIVIRPFFTEEEIDEVIDRKVIEDVMKGKLGDKIDFLSRINDIVDRCLEKAQINEKKIDRVVMVGGSSHIPCIKQLMEKKFGKSKIYLSHSTSETVARGAAIWAAYLLDKKNAKEGKTTRHLNRWSEINIKEKNAHALGVLLDNGSVSWIIQSNQFTPAVATSCYVPAFLSADGATAILDPLTIMQGKDIIGKLEMPTIYAHGRVANNILIKITFIAEPTEVKVKAHVAKGNKDGSDINEELEIKMG